MWPPFRVIPKKGPPHPSLFHVAMLAIPCGHDGRDGWKRVPHVGHSEHHLLVRAVGRSWADQTELSDEAGPLLGRLL